MNIRKYIEENKKIQNSLLDYLHNESDNEETFTNLKNIFDDIKIYSNQYEIKTLFYLIVKISNNMQRNIDFFSKIEKILLLFKNDMTNYFSNSELFHIFRSNKRLILFLLEEKIIIFNKKIAKQIINQKYIDKKYPQYFMPEIRPFINEDWFPNHEFVKEIEQEIPNDFYEKRKIGENDNYICQLIQKDLVKDFIIYVNKTSISLSSLIIPYIYETNSLLFNKTTLIEYAAFYGSIQIFNYLKLNEVEIEKSLWIYAIHGLNGEIIHFLEENKILPKDESYQECLIESIKCHHIEVFNYIQNNYIDKTIDYLNDSLKYYNFELIENDQINKSSFCIFCKYDYYIIVDNLLKNEDIDVNMKIIHNKIKRFSTIHKEETPLFLAVKKNNIEIVKLLLNTDKIDVNILNKGSKNGDYLFDKTALCLAVEKDNFQIVKLLVENEKIDINKMNNLWYHYDDDYPVYEKTVLFVAVENENCEMIELLLTNNNIDVNAISNKNDYGNDNWKRWEKTALFLAIKRGNIKIVELLLNNKNINVNFLNKLEGEAVSDFNFHLKEKWKGDASKSYNAYGFKKTALYLAIENENIEIINLLLNNKNIDLNIINFIKWGESVTDNIDQYEKTALYLAIEKENIEIIELLLSNNKIDVNIINEWWFYIEKHMYDYYEEEDDEENNKNLCFLEYIKPKWCGENTYLEITK